MIKSDYIADKKEKILITGANGFIGKRVVNALLEYGFSNLCCLVRPTGDIAALTKVIGSYPRSNVEVVKGNLLSRYDCEKVARETSVVLHLAAGVEKTFPGCFMNSVVTTRNLLDACLTGSRLKRFLNVSSFAVYAPTRLRRGAILDESCEVESQPHLRADAYCYGKVKQDDLIIEYNRKHNLPFVIVRPGAVYGPGKNAITGRVGLDTFGFFLHMGNSNEIPFTYVDNCADAIVMAGLRPNLENEAFNIVDDRLPRSRDFLRDYKRNVQSFFSINISPYLSYLLCFLWEKYSDWSKGQLPPVFNRRRWAAEWKGHRYSNSKLKRLTGWRPRISTEDGMARFFEFAKAQRNRQR